MAKTRFSKSELINMHNLLIQNKMFPIAKIGVYQDVINSGYRHNYYVVQFLSDSRKQLDFGFVSRTDQKIDLLQKQLEKYFQ